MMLLELRYRIADLRLTLTLRRVSGALDDLLRKYRPDQPRMPRGVPEGGEWTIDPTSARQQAQQAERVRVAATGPKCDGFSGGCQSGGTFGTTGMFKILGMNLCRDCAVKYFSLEDLSATEQMKYLMRLDPNGFRSK